MQDLTKNTTRQEKKDFDKRQRRALADRDWDAMMEMEFIMDD